MINVKIFHFSKNPFILLLCLIDTYDHHPSFSTLVSIIPTKQTPTLFQLFFHIPLANIENYLDDVDVGAFILFTNQICLS
jgi:hypothetical protein